MDDVKDENEKKFTITVFYVEGKEVFNNCSMVNASERELVFADQNNKSHEFYGLAYHVAEE